MSDAQGKSEKLSTWQSRFERASTAYATELGSMDDREKMYRGERRLTPVVDNQKMEKTHHVRNIVAELVEAQVSSTIPYPKVTARRKQDEHLAQIIEDMLRNEIDRLPFELINDMAERTVPIQGGVFYLVEWDSLERTRFTTGELSVSVVHPKQVIPQAGVYTSVEDMDYIFVTLPETKGYIRSRYGKDVSNEREDAPEAKSPDGASTAEDIVTLKVAYYRNAAGGIGRYAWVGDTELEDLEDYQARRVRKCAICGEPEPPSETSNSALADEGEGKHSATRAVCPKCGASEWRSAPEEYEELYIPQKRTDGTFIPGATAFEYETTDEDGLVHTVQEEVPTRIPYYKPDIYPLILQRNVSLFGHLLGDSDVDRISDQQNTSSTLEEKIVKKLSAAGSLVITPPDATISVNDKDMRVLTLATPEDAQFIRVLDLEGDISQDMAMLQQVYEEARQTIGITDSFQGRRDTTATSGKAKEFAAAQTAGRLDSKRAMKEAAYASIYEAMFKFRLAYAAEPRTVVAREPNGATRYEQFNRWDFLERDENREWYWNDQFLFSVDASAALAANREAMWQETRMNLQSGAFGNPADPETLIMFWRKMETLHYPGAGETREYIEKQIEKQQPALPQQAMSPQMETGMPAVGTEQLWGREVF